MSEQPLEVTQFRYGMADLQTIAQIQHELHPLEPIDELVSTIKGNTNHVAQLGDAVMGRVTVSHLTESIVEGSISHRLTMVVAAADCFAEKTEREQVQQGLLDAAESVAQTRHVEKLGVIADPDNLKLLDRNGYCEIGSTILNGTKRPVLQKEFHQY